MTTNEKNQLAINEFYEGYGEETAKEYGQAILDLVLLLQSGGQATPSLLLDTTGRLNSLYRLISSISPDERVCYRS